MATVDMVLSAAPGLKPSWAEGSISKLIETAQGELALRAAAQVLDEHAARLGQRVAEVARVRHPRGNWEAIYARLEPPAEPEAAPAPEPPAPGPSPLTELTEQLDKSTSDLARIVGGQS